MKKGLEASYTVEAAFILPIVFALLYGLLFLGFYLHDRAVLEQCAWESAFYGAGQLENPSETEIDSYLRKQLKGGLLVSWIKEVEITQREKEVEVRLSGKASALNFTKALTGVSQRTALQVRRTAQYPNAAEYVRKRLVLIEQAKKLKALQEE